ncbi:MAG: hypothetical protein A3B31_00525 [Candidatus Komeilibacteria bacterium RIFCSPLOWO2_01_FULL_53_11]|uniref:Uncharacterized protein n=1 Tax=Candidatus Komeilibacteria bacterium RIFCSPLOWO2_01_FULL_53_11 TaxID=1798552 RepID=A0A1G2BVT4_9BACT|nr:MAG: hypothetical protein A3B31_00525 [Candidatus Komeilibacteria bacterium RIFCSPLOWO2_01_FULL_53_11]
MFTTDVYRLAVYREAIRDHLLADQSTLKERREEVHRLKAVCESMACVLGLGQDEVTVQYELVEQDLRALSPAERGSRFAEASPRIGR